MLEAVGEGELLSAIVRGLSASASVDVQIHHPDGRLLRGPARVRALSLEDLRRALSGETVRTPERCVFAIEHRGEKLVCAVFQQPKYPSGSGQRSIADVGALLSKLRDRELTTQTIVSLAVPDLADACILDVVEPHGAIRQREVAARDTEARELLKQLQDHGPDPNTQLPAAIALRTGNPVLVPDVRDAALERWTKEPEHLAALRRLAPRSTIAAPLIVRGEVIGALTLHRLTARPFTPVDLSVVDEIARFAALALENAVLFEALGHAHKEAAAARDRFYGILMRAPFAIAMREGPDHVLRIANERYLELTKRRDMIGHAFAKTFPYLPEHLEILDRAYFDGETYANAELRTRVMEESGVEREMFVDFVVQPVRSANGAIEGTISFAVDVTSLVRAREEAEGLARSLSDQQRWLEALLDQLPVPVVLQDAQQGTILFANKAADRVAGGSFPRVRHGRAELFQTTDVRGRRVAEADLPAHRAARGERVEGVQLEWSTPGGTKSLLTNAILLPQQEGHIDTVVVAFNDITQLKKVEAELQKAVRVRDEFLSIASHELKTPLTAMRLQVQGLLRAARGGDEGRFSPERVITRLDAIDRNVDRLSALIDRLLSLPRITSGRLSLERESMDLAELVDEVVARFVDETSRAGSKLTATVARPLPGRWDRLRLDQVLTNLLANAVKYGRGSPIDVVLEDGGEVAVLVVRDRGIGIAPEDHARIFERWERAVSERNYGGFGLGLYISRHIVEAHGGMISVDSAPGSGATFVARLPKN